MIDLFVIVKQNDSAVKVIKKRKASHFSYKRTDIDEHRYFFTVTVHSRKGEIDKKALSRYVGNLRNSLIFPDTVLKENKVLSMRRLMNASPLFIKSLGQKAAMRICINDAECCAAHLTEKLIPYAHSLHVICPDKYIYTKEAQRLFVTYGISVSVSQKWNKSVSDCNLLITPTTKDLPSDFGGAVFTTDSAVSALTQVYLAEGIELPCFLELMRPVCTDKNVFAACLYEKCSVSEIEGCPFESVTHICSRS